MVSRFERARSRALARSTSPAIAVAVARYRARARRPHVEPASGPGVASGPSASGSGATAPGALSCAVISTQVLIQIKLQQTLKMHRKINTNQKNTNELSKCSVKQTLSNGVIGQHK